MVHISKHSVLQNCACDWLVPFSAAAFLLVSLIPSPHFRQGYRTARTLASPHKEMLIASEAQLVLHQVYTVLLHLLKPARHYTDIQTHGTMKLTAYFALLTYCVISRTEKLMVSINIICLSLWEGLLCEPHNVTPTCTGFFALNSISSDVKIL
jgi:hypothetical protein